MGTIISRNQGNKTYYIYQETYREKLNKKDLNLKNLIKISKEFSLNSNLLKNKKVIRTIKRIESKNSNASMIMLGNAVFSDKYFKDSKELIIKDKGACLC